MKSRLWLFVVMLPMLTGCHSVRASIHDSPQNHVEIAEHVRPWPVTIHKRYYFVLPPGQYAYNPHDLSLQSNLPERPIRVVEAEELRQLNPDALGDGVTGWIAIYRAKVDIQLIRYGSPETYNGCYRTRVPMASPGP